MNRLKLRSVKLDNDDITLLDSLRTPDTGLIYFVRKGLAREKKEREAKEGRESVNQWVDGFLVRPKQGKLRFVEYFDKKCLTDYSEVRILDIQEHPKCRKNNVLVHCKALGKKEYHNVQISRENIDREVLRRWAV